MLRTARSDMIIHDSTPRPGRRLGVVLGLEALLLAAAVPLFQRPQGARPMLAAAACGLRNAMASAHTGAVVRTTRRGGMFTDLDIGIGHALRAMPLQQGRLLPRMLIIVACILAGGVDAPPFTHMGYAVLFVPAALTSAVGRHPARRQWRALPEGRAT